MNFECKKCKHTDYVLKEVGTATGLYCAKCGFWHKWIPKHQVESYKNKEQTEPTTAEKLLWLVENRFISYIKYPQEDGMIEVTLNSYKEKVSFPPIVPTYAKYGKTSEEVINAAYKWAKEQG